MVEQLDISTGKHEKQEACADCQTSNLLNVTKLLQCNCVNQVNYISGAALLRASLGIGTIQYHGKQIGTVRVGGKKSIML